MIQKFKSGEKIRNPSHLNQIVDGVNEIIQGKSDGAPDAAQAGVTAFAINQSGVDLPFGACVPFKESLDAIPYPDDPTKMIQGTVLLLDTPAEDGAEWCITAQRIPAGLSGLIYISGTILVRVKDEESTDVTVTINTTADWWHLKRGTEGAGKIIWAGSVTESTDDDTEDYRWALIRFPIGGGGGSASLTVVQATSDGAAGVIPVKVITLKADVAASPNFEQATGDPSNVNYYRI